MSERISRGNIVFDDMTEDAFESLVEETLEQSEFIEVEQVAENTYVIEEVEA